MISNVKNVDFSKFIPKNISVLNTSLDEKLVLAQKSQMKKILMM